MNNIQYKKNPYHSSKHICNKLMSYTIPQIFYAGKNAYVVWQDNTLGNDEIIFRYNMMKISNKLLIK